MAINNALNTSLAGQSGTGSFVGNNSPILIAPNIGVANATSISFNSGADTLSSYIEGAWTPAFTFSTVGDLTVSYAAQTGYYQRIGNLVFIKIYLSFTPTYTTSAGQAVLTGLPFVAALGLNQIGGVFNNANITYPVGRTVLQLSIGAGSNTITPVATGSNTVQTGLGPISFTTGVSTIFIGSAIYQV